MPFLYGRTHVEMAWVIMEACSFPPLSMYTRLSTCLALSSETGGPGVSLFVIYGNNYHIHRRAFASSTHLACANITNCQPTTNLLPAKELRSFSMLWVRFLHLHALARLVAGAFPD